MGIESATKGWILYFVVMLIPALLILNKSSEIFGWVDSIMGNFSQARNGGN